MVDSKLIEKITDEHKLIASELLKRINMGELRVTYGELEKFVEKEFGVGINAHLTVPHKIGLISEICFELGLPMISVVVVNQNTQLPGTGFYKLYDKLHNTNYTGNPVLEDKIRKEVKDEVQNCKDWSKLTKFLGIEV